MATEEARISSQGTTLQCQRCSRLGEGAHGPGAEAQQSRLGGVVVHVRKGSNLPAAQIVPETLEFLDVSNKWATRVWACCIGSGFRLVFGFMLGLKTLG
ncbi:hypothetical protein GOBAR_DD01480 [Gossypium barbadense]|uniref:Uncharacterized protein n=1 Tax=Gossypium tomentosum TaxID=34277 RepID=A0A5D2LBG3_GOSTO|nr:hypothetical protein GOBAR_DD01480 [Gossypium barbadense]TYH76524.1 hypothetical protein ES332_D04G092700v1 [Gossypium tomentosum]